MKFGLIITVSHMHLHRVSASFFFFSIFRARLRRCCVENAFQVDATSGLPVTPLPLALFTTFDRGFLSPSLALSQATVLFFFSGLDTSRPHIRRAKNLLLRFVSDVLLRRRGSRKCLRLPKIVSSACSEPDSRIAFAVVLFLFIGSSSFARCLVEAVNALGAPVFLQRIDRIAARSRCNEFLCA